jgi:hypothetical protein
METHRITNADLENKVGDCSVCGVGVPLQVASKPQKGKSHLQRYCHKGRLAHKKRRYQNKPDNYNWTKLGVTLEDVEQLKAEQNGLCAICQTNPATDLDHCHTTNKVRAVLCHGCNTGLGLFKDNSDTLIRAAQYLTTHQNL